MANKSPSKNRSAGWPLAPVVTVGVVGVVVGLFLGWMFAGGQSGLSGKERGHVESFQRRIDQAMEPVVAPLDDEGNFMAFPQLFTDGQGFRNGDIDGETLAETAERTMTVSGEAAATIDTIPFTAIQEDLTPETASQMGYALLQLRLAMELYGQSADLYGLAAEAPPASRSALLDRADALRSTADGVLRDAYTEYNYLVRSAGLDPVYGGEPAAPVGGA